jgi:hypothetical protein
LGAFISYYLIKIVPFWGLSLIATSVLFLSPLIYKTNQELIDQQIEKISKIANQQANQVRSVASQHAARATETTKAYVGDYSAKAQEMIGSVRQRSVSPVTTKATPKSETKPTTESTTPAAPAYSSSDFPEAPKEEFKKTPIAEEFGATDAVPSVASTANALKVDEEPLLAI